MNIIKETIGLADQIVQAFDDANNTEIAAIQEMEDISKKIKMNLI